ncbi:MAG: mechanosensitive ion channel family protein, partial [Acidimicrobiia bacterium]
MRPVAQVDVGNTVENVWANIIEWVPLLVGFLLILIVGWLVARLLEKGVDKLLEKVGFDRWVSRGGIDRAMREVPYDPSSMVAKLVFFAVMLFALQLAFGVFGPNPVSDLIAGVVAYLPNILVAIVLIVVTAFIANAVREIVASALGRLSYGRALST